MMPAILRIAKIDVDQVRGCQEVRTWLIEPTWIRIGWLSRSAIPWSAWRAERIGPTSEASWHWKTATSRVMNPSTGSSKTMSALSIPDQGLACRVVVDLEGECRTPGDLPPGAGVPVSGQTGGPGLVTLCEIVEVVGAVVVVASSPSVFFEVAPSAHSRTTSAITRTSATCPIPAPQRWFFVQLVGCSQVEVGHLDPWVRPARARDVEGSGRRA